MARSAADYDKETFGDKAGAFFRIFGLSLAGAVIGSFPYAVLLCFFDISMLILFVLAGLGAAIFCAIIGRRDNPDIYGREHVPMIFGGLLSTVIVNVLVYAIHYAPAWGDVEGLPTGNFARTFYAYTHIKADYFSGGKLVVYDNGFSLITVHIVAAVCLLIGMYITFAFVKISRKSEKKSKKR